VPSVAPGLVNCCSSIVRVSVSDAISIGEPALVATFASPKSKILAWPRSVTKILAGLMSRCTIPLEWVARDFVGKEFQGDETMQPGVLGLIHYAHAAATELFHDAVVRDGTCRSCGPVMLGPEACEVNETATLTVGSRIWIRVLGQGPRCESPPP
jgi:hypothetical protein